MIKIKFDEIKIDKSQEFDEAITENSIKRELNRNIGFLYTHNKNFTKDQWRAVCKLVAIIDGIKE